MIQIIYPATITLPSCTIPRALTSVGDRPQLQAVSAPLSSPAEAAMPSATKNRLQSPLPHPLHLPAPPEAPFSLVMLLMKLSGCKQKVSTSCLGADYCGAATGSIPAGASADGNPRGRDKVVLRALCSASTIRALTA